MKKIVVSLLFCTLLACSNSDSSSDSSYTYNADIMQTCPNGTVKSYDISESTYNSLSEQMNSSGTCLYVTFKDIHNLNQKGYIKAVGKTN